MHDIHLAQQIINLAKEHAQRNGIKKIRKIKVLLGDIEEHGELINPENLEFNMKLLMRDDLLDVDILRVHKDNWELMEIEGT